MRKGENKTLFHTMELSIIDNKVHTPSLNSQFLVNHKSNCDYFNTLDGIPRNIYEHNPNCALFVDF